jgi:hypothetical protein
MATEWRLVNSASSKDEQPVLPVVMTLDQKRKRYAELDTRYNMYHKKTGFAERIVSVNGQPPDNFALKGDEVSEYNKLREELSEIDKPIVKVGFGEKMVSMAEQSNIGADSGTGVGVSQGQSVSQQKKKKNPTRSILSVDNSLASVNRTLALGGT